MRSDNNENRPCTKYMESSNGDGDIDEDDDDEFIDESDDDDDDNVNEDEDNEDNDYIDNDDDERRTGGLKSSDEDVKTKAVVLQGSLHLNEEERYVYSGTWTMQGTEPPSKEEIPKEAEEGVTNNGCDNNNNNNNNNNNKDKKKKRKFKLKSKLQLKDESNTGGSSSDATATNLLTTVLPHDDNNNNTIHEKPQSILFDGFFVTDETDTIQPHRRVKERDVEITFSRISNTPTRGSTNTNTNTNNSGNDMPASKRRYRVEGRGANEFGAFRIDGTYTPQQQHRPQDHGAGKGGRGLALSVSQSLTCRKWYTPIIKPAKRRWDTADGGNSEDYGYRDESDNHCEMSGDEAPDFEEVIGLQNEASMSIEDLRKMYYGGRQTTDNEDEHNQTDTKRCKFTEDDDDDGCGF